MARIRSIKPDFFFDEEIASLPFEYRLLFIGLWPQADKAGRLEDRPVMLKAKIFPYDEVDVSKGLQALSKKFIQRYEWGGKRFIQINTWEKHQRCPTSEPDSIIQGPGATKENILKRQNSSGREGKGREGKGRDDIAPSPTDSEPLFDFPTVGSGPKTWTLSKAKSEEYAKSYPGIDIIAECRAARQWCLDNPPRRKTARGMPAFLNRWLSKAQNTGRRSGKAFNGTQHDPWKAVRRDK